MSCRKCWLLPLVLALCEQRCYPRRGSAWTVHARVFCQNQSRAPVPQTGDLSSPLKTSFSSFCHGPPHAPLIWPKPAISANKGFHFSRCLFPLSTHTLPNTPGKRSQCQTDHGAEETLPWPMDTAHLFLRGRTQGHKGLPTPGSWGAEVHTTLQCTLRRHKGLMGLSKQ